MSFVLRAERPITGLTLKGFVPDDFPQLTRNFDIGIADPQFRFSADTNGSFAFFCPIEISVGDSLAITVRRDRDYNAAAAGKGSDRRIFAYRLVAIELAHPAAPDEPR